MDSEPNSPRAGQTPRAPISLEGERRKAMKLIYAMERDAEAFREKWLIGETDENADDWVEFLNLAKGKGPGYRSCKDMSTELSRIKNEQGFLGGRAMVIEQLLKLCDRVKAFNDMYNLCQQRISDALDSYMYKYCLSFFTELEGRDVECVREYENSINDWRQEISSAIIDAGKQMEELNDLMTISFINFIGSYGEVLHLMNSILDAFVSVTEPFRSWVTADEGYLKKVNVEMGILLAERKKIKALIRKNTHCIEEARSKSLRSSFDNKKLEAEVRGKSQSRNYYRKREFSFSDKIELTENILQEKKFDLDEAMVKLQTRPIHSLVRQKSDGLKAQTEKMQKEVQLIEQRLSRMVRGKRDVRQERYSVQKEYHHLRGVYSSNVKKARKQNEHFLDQIQTVKDLHEELSEVEHKINSLRRIFETKSHPATVKKIYFQGHSPGEKMDFRGYIKTGLLDPPGTLRHEKTVVSGRPKCHKDSLNKVVSVIFYTLREAIDVAAMGVGKDWGKMYQNLPFNPPRDTMKRAKDLEAMDMDFKSVHPPTEQMALRSLAKWKSLSRTTSVNALVRTLKSIKKAEVAKKIEKQVLTVVN